ncbi:MAG: glycosyltransferase [Saonia sp.]
MLAEETSIKKILIIGFVWPEPNSTAAGSRMLQLIHFFIQEGYQVTFASTAIETEFTMDLTELGVSKAAIRLNHSSFDTFIKKLAPEIVLFDRFMVEEQFGWRVAQHAPKALRILDTEDLHSIRFVREATFKANQPFSMGAWLKSDMTKREIASIYRSDLSLIISSYEMELLQRVLRMDEKLIVHLPFLLDRIEEVTPKQWLPFEERKDFVCIGSGKHTPNNDAVHWLKTEIWPLIRAQLPKTNLYIYGSYLPDNIKKLHAPKAGFYVMGRAQDSGQVLGSAKVSLAPLRFGAGIKGKLVESMLCGTPNVTTSIGAEGMCGPLHWNGKIANTPETFAKAAVDLYKDNFQWEHARQNGIVIINEWYDKDFLIKRLATKMETLTHTLEAHRTQNFIGSMLQHHTMAGTKYMAKWIEAKNRE